jgi:hypothetical protein
MTRKAPPNKPIMSLSPIVMSVGDNTAIIRNLFVERLCPSGVDRTNPAFPIPGFGVAKCLRPSPMEWRHFFKIGKLRWFPAPSQFFRPQYDFIAQATTIRTDKEVALQECRKKHPTIELRSQKVHIGPTIGTSYGLRDVLVRIKQHGTACGDPLCGTRIGCL